MLSSHNCSAGGAAQSKKGNMALAYYYVLIDGTQWKVRHNQKDYPCQTKFQALRAAITAAHQSGKDGHEAQVFAQSRDGKWRAAWTYGYDPFPPEPPKDGPMKKLPSGGERQR